MKKLIALFVFILPAIISGAPNKHRVRMVFNVVDGRTMETIQDVSVDKMMFNSITGDDTSLEFIKDIGFKYIASLTVNLNNDLEKKEQVITIRTTNNRIIIKKLEFFKCLVGNTQRYLVDPKRLKKPLYDMDFYYFIAYSS